MKARSLSALLFLAASQPLFSNVLYVDSTPPASGAWSTAYTNLQDAIAAASPGDEIWVATGTYYPDEGTGQSDNGRLSTFFIGKDLSIYGGFPSDGSATQLSDRDPAAYPTTLSAEIQQDEDNTNNAYHVVTINDSDDGLFKDVLLDSLTIENGYANNNDGNSNHRGGGIICRENLNLYQVTISNNYANGYGGGIALAIGSCIFLDCTFQDNISDGTGGGGAILTNALSLIISDSQFLDNSATNAVGDGGAIRTSSNENSLALLNCLLAGNSARNGGAVYNALPSNSLFTNCAFRGNKATLNGGALFNQSSAPSLTNCTFQGNNASSSGGALVIDGNSTLTNCIIWDNAENGSTTEEGSSVEVISGTPVYAHCLVQNIDLSSTGTSNLDGTDAANDPLFLNPTDPLSAPASAGDLRLTSTSPAIDAGGNSLNGNATDLAGNPRKRGTIDLGAYEQQGVLFVDKNCPSPGDGSSWATAFADLQDALDVVTSNQEIRIAQGTYYPSLRVDPAIARTETFLLDKSLVIFGGFPTGGGMHDPVSTPTILSGEIQQDDDTLNNCGTVVSIYDGTDSTFQNVYLNGLIITAGRNIAIPTSTDTARGNPEDKDSGGGIYCQENLTLIQVAATQNFANGHGGGLFLRGNKSSLINCTFSGNSVYNVGGGLYLLGQESTLTNCTISGNSAANGGGLVSQNLEALSLTNCAFKGNHAIQYSAEKGNGGGFINLLTSTKIINCTFQGNKADELGGAVINTGLELLGSQRGILPIPITFNNCIVWGNMSNGSTSTTNASIFNPENNDTFSHCLVQNMDLSSTGNGNLDGTDAANDPLFVAPVDPLSTPVIGGDLRLLSGSPALDAGLNASNSEELDLARKPRISSGTIDLGAYEGSYVTFAHLHPGLSPNDDDNHNGHSNFADYAVGGDPAGQHNPSLYPTLADGLLTLGYRNDAADITVEFQKSANLINWEKMTEGLDYVLDSSSSSGSRTILTLDLLIGPPTVPAQFFREEFSTSSE